MRQSPEEFLRKWMNRVNARDSEGACALYNKDAVLIPTFSNRLLNTPQAIREYFDRLCGREDLSLALHEKTVKSHPLNGPASPEGASIYTLCGIYCWRFSIDEELLSFEARFSCLVDLALPRPILLHHSSQIPRAL